MLSLASLPSMYKYQLCQQCCPPPAFLLLATSLFTAESHRSGSSGVIPLHVPQDTQGWFG